MPWGWSVTSLWVMLFILSSCGWKAVTPLQQSTEDHPFGARGEQTRQCLDSEYYIPRQGETAITPLRTIRVNFHFMNSRDSSKNLSGLEAVRFATELVASANHDLAHNQPMRLPLGNETPVLDPLIRYEIDRKSTGQPAIYEHFDDENYYLVKKGPYRNNYQSTVIERYGVGTDSILNIFVQAPPPDSMMGENYGGLKTGVALRRGIRISGPFLDDARVYTYTGLFNHEVGHVLGLRHSWVRDQCEDTPEHSNCWNFTQNGSECDSLVSNNVMDSNADQDALTPCQIGIIHQSLSVDGKRGRSYQSDSYCIKQPMPPLRIRDTVRWCREIDAVTDIIIEKNSRLIISGRLSMPRGSRIYIEKNGKLVLEENARIENACGYSWEGIYSKSKGEDQVTIEDGGRIVLTP